MSRLTTNYCIYVLYACRGHNNGEHSNEHSDASRSMHKAVHSGAVEWSGGATQWSGVQQGSEAAEQQGGSMAARPRGTTDQCGRLEWCSGLV